MPKKGDLVYGKELGYVLKSHTWRWTACPTCGRERWVRNVPRCLKANCRVCNGSLTGRQSKLSGSTNPSWKGGRAKTQSGYISVWLPLNSLYYSMVTKSGHVLEHRLIMAQHLGRCLEKWEVVHHINGDRSDNRIENLSLLDAPHHSQSSILKVQVTRLTKEVVELRKQVRLLKWQVGCLNRERRYNCIPTNEVANDKEES